MGVQALKTNLFYELSNLNVSLANRIELLVTCEELCMRIAHNGTHLTCIYMYFTLFVVFVFVHDGLPR